MGQEPRETSMPIVPDWGEGILNIVSRIHALRPKKADIIAPILLTCRLKSPQIKGPRKEDPIAPQEIPKIKTMVAGLK